MDGFVWLIVALAVLVLVFRKLSEHGGRRAAWLRRERMPTELETAELIASERNFRCERPVALSGTPDQVYRLSDGRLVLLETKRRRRAQVFDSDIAQLSIYRVLLKSQSRFQQQPVADYGYVRLVTPRGVTYQPVTLWDDARIIALHRRFWALRQGQVNPTGAPNAGVCRSCGHRSRCPQARV